GGDGSFRSWSNRCRCPLGCTESWASTSASVIRSSIRSRSSRAPSELRSQLTATIVDVADLADLSAPALPCVEYQRPSTAKLNSAVCSECRRYALIDILSHPAASADLVLFLEVSM